MFHCIRFLIPVTVPAGPHSEGFVFQQDEIVSAEIMPTVRKREGEWVEMATIWTRDGRAGSNIFYAWFAFVE